jgi:glutathione S-transferase
MFGGDKPGQEKYDKVKENLGWLDGFVKDGKFSAGNDDMTIGDLALLATYSTLRAADLPEIDLGEYKNVGAWYERCCKLVPNYEKANGEGATAFGGFFKSKASA